MPTTLPFREALNKGIVSGVFADTKIILFSRRDSSGRVHGPKALYASSHVLKSVPYFNDREHLRQILAATGELTKWAVPKVLFGDFSEADLRDLDDEIGDYESTAEDFGYYSDSDLEDDGDEEPTLPTPARDGSSAGSSRTPRNPALNGYNFENHTKLSNKGKIIGIPDIAFTTFQAFIFYLYMGQIEFSTPGSQRNKTPSGDRVSQSSPKSIYRLADKYDIPALKDLALGHIRAGLKNRDVVEETFSAFTSRYDDIKMVCVPQLVSALRNDTAEKATWKKVCEILNSHDFKGDPGHVAGVFGLLWESVNQDDDCLTTATVDDTPDPAPVNSSASCDPLQAAIIKSIHTGVFFDRKYLTRQTKKGSIMKAVYCASVVLGNGRETRIAQFNDEIAAARDPEEAIDTESDCYSTASEDRAVEGQDRSTGIIIPRGSYSTWRSIVFYLCTGQISFAPLRSQGAGSRARHILENITAESPPPCSPKSIYVLANLLNVQPLCDLAFKDIENKISEGNVVEELFSCITAKEQRVTEMEYRLLLSKFKNKDTISRARDKISGTPSDHLAHRARVIEFGIRAALDRQKPNPQVDKTNGVALQCYSSSCPGHTQYTPYSSIVSKAACPHCNYWVLKCVGCGSEWYNLDSTECVSCKKRFL